MRKLLTLAALAMLSLGTAGTIAQAADKPNKAVYHLNSGSIDTQKDVLRNTQNHIDAIGKDNLELRVVMHAGGVSMLQTAKTDESIKSSIDNLKLQGVKFVVCKKTLDSKKINYKTDLYDVSEKDIVPSGVAEIATLQSKGFSYVKP
jgi:intracellular sulfur oxidation DsrE/DsrF family protein